MTSREKIEHIADELQRQPPGQLGMLGAMLPSVAPIALSQLPEEPGELDELLEKGAQFLVSLRSDREHVQDDAIPA
jgi:hypothetical protein